MDLKFFFLFLFLLTFNLAQGQYYEEPSASASSADIAVGEPYRVVDAPLKFYFHRGGEILTVKIDGKKIIIQKLDAETLSFKKVRVFDDMPKDFQIENVMKFNEGYYVFYSVWDGAKELEQLFYREINFDEGSFAGEGKRIVAVEGKISGSPIGKISFWSYGSVDKFDFQLSYDKSKMLVQYRMRPKTKRDAKNHDVIGMSVFDSKMTLLWEKAVEMPYTEKKMNNLDYSIDTEGNTYILASVFDDNTTDIKKSKNGKANYHIELLRIKANSTDIKITPIDLEDKFINDISLFESPANYMICAGFYNKGKDLGDASGIIMFKVGAEGELYDKATYEIPLDVLNLYANNREVRRNKKEEAKGKAEFENINLQELLVKEDGSIILIGEQAYTVTHHHYSNGRSYTTTTYHYNDMLITRINPNGQFGWMKKLPKRQKGGAGQGGMSYKYLAGENNHYLLFLDNVKNMELPLDEMPEEHVDGRGGFLTAYQINDDSGEINKISLLDTRDVKGMEVYQFMTSRIVPLTHDNWVIDKEFAVEVYKKKKEDVLIKVAINE